MHTVGGRGFSSTVGESSACEILRKDPQVNVEIRFSREEKKILAK